MTEKTLFALRHGGIFDQVGAGFHRYSTDREWIVPHFEKMLYDQAMLAMAYIEGYQATGNDLFARTAGETLDYVLEDLTADGGGFYSSRDADSEGEEGKFYLWTEKELREALSAREADIAVAAFNVKKEGNYRDPSTRDSTGRNILHTKDFLLTAERLGLTEKELWKELVPIRRRLYAVRRKRAAPARDEKILADWNGLMISAFARAAAVFGNRRYAGAAKKAADLILAGRQDDGSLYHRCVEGEWGVPAFLDDYAFLAGALLDLYEATFETAYQTAAFDLAAYMVRHFSDAENGGFFFTSSGSEEVLGRRREYIDAAYPSGNSMAALDLVRIARMKGDTFYESIAEKAISSAGTLLARGPSAFTQLLQALDFIINRSCEVMIAGIPGKEDTAALLNALRGGFVPNKTVLFNVPSHPMIEGKATAYVCSNHTCRHPTSSPAELLAQLS